MALSTVQPSEAEVSSPVGPLNHLVSLILQRTLVPLFKELRGPSLCVLHVDVQGCHPNVRLTSCCSCKHSRQHGLSWNAALGVGDRSQNSCDL